MNEKTFKVNDWFLVAETRNQKPEDYYFLELH
jgi:hypothetical protein